MADRLWPAVRRSAALLLALGACAGAFGCGHANAPCPTPPALLDAHRGQSEALQQDLGRVSDETGQLEGRREEAMARIQEAQAAEDSLARLQRPASASRKGRR